MKDPTAINTIVRYIILFSAWVFLYIIFLVGLSEMFSIDMDVSSSGSSFLLLAVIYISLLITASLASYLNLNQYMEKQSDGKLYIVMSIVVSLLLIYYAGN